MIIATASLPPFLVATIALNLNFFSIALATCRSGYFQCSDGDCIFQEWRCDHYSDCDDSSDEQNCPTHRSCGASQFTCANGACIAGSWKCDGEFDCPDSSDEKGCNCSNSQWKCPSGLCISNTWRCDGDNDCGDGSDENGCSPTPTPSSQCSSNEFQCSNKFCIPVNWVCDTHDDCNDNSDEVDSICRVRTCMPNQFTCSSGQCIKSTWKCDGDADCEDKSDEATCTVVSQTPPPPQCPNEFECADKKLCISLNWRCDAEADCFDSSDELNCGKCSTGFLCTDKPCLHTSKKCDGTRDCTGGEDEAGCSSPPAPTQLVCTAPSIRCDSKCVAVNQLCDGNRDCSDGIDEVGCDNECEQGTHNCSRNEICIDERSGFRCECKPGYRRDTTISLCRAVKQCATISGLCDHLCIDTSPGFRCDCYPHFQLFGSSSCKLTGQDPYLVYIYNRVIHTMSFTSENRKIIVPALRSPLALEYNYAEQILFFSDNFLHKIFVTNLDGTGTPTVLVEGDGMDSPDGLAYDWIHRVLYWTDGHRETVEAYDFRTRRRQVLFNEMLDEPRAIIVDPLDGVGYIYFTDWGSPAKIEKAKVSGADRTVLVSETVGWPNGLTLDIYRRHLYWIDAKLKYVKRVNVDGTNIITIQLSSSFHPYALTSFDEELFWTDWDKHGIMKVGTNSPSPPTFVRNHLNGASPLSIKVVHPHRQPTLADYSPCKVNNGGCSHVCTEVNFKAECRCPAGLSLYSDGKACLSSLTSCPSYNFCYNNGTCIAGSTLSCKCGRHHSGPRCENLVSSPCEINNGGCDQICVNGRQGLAICKCRENYNLLSDFKTCLSSELFRCPNYCVHGLCTEGLREPQCKCDSRYTGLRCNVELQRVSTPSQLYPTPTKGSHNEKTTGTSGTVGVAVGAAIGSLVIVIIVIVVIILVQRRKMLKRHANFDNPVYTNKAVEVTLSKKPVQKNDTIAAVNMKPPGTFI